MFRVDTEQQASKYLLATWANFNHLKTLSRCLRCPVSSACDLISFSAKNCISVNYMRRSLALDISGRAEAKTADGGLGLNRTTPKRRQSNELGVFRELSGSGQLCEGIEALARPDNSQPRRPLCISPNSRISAQAYATNMDALSVA
jgi:hypothetical protein